MRVTKQSVVIVTLLSFFAMSSPVSVHASGVIENATPVGEVLTNILQFLLSVSGILAILSSVVSGVFYMLSSGDEQRAATAKRMMLFSMVGVAVVLASLVIVMQIANFF